VAGSMLYSPLGVFLVDLMVFCSLQEKLFFFTSFLRIGKPCLYSCDARPACWRVRCAWGPDASLVLAWPSSSDLRKKESFSLWRRGRSWEEKWRESS